MNVYALVNGELRMWVVGTTDHQIARAIVCHELATQAVNGTVMVVIDGGIAVKAAA